MCTFDEWIQQEAQHHDCLQRWRKKLLELGVSWQSFRRNNQQQEITNDLVLGGIPIVAARDIVALASKQMKQSTAPMAIFWDLETIHIPAHINARDIVNEIKTKLAPHGHLVQFRAYTSMGLHLIPPNTRSDLQLAGCHLVDCPHGSRKDVVDKMIIVDAMHFAYQLPDNASICFVTDDMDYTYFFAVLQHNKNWRTIMMSNETVPSKLRVNCDIRMIWEKDIVQPIAGRIQEQVDPHRPYVPTNELPKTMHSSPMNDAAKDGVSKDEVEELIRSAMLRLSMQAGKSTFFTSSDVASMIQEMNPLRFRNRNNINAFLKEAVASGVVHEEGEGPNEMMTLQGLPVVGLDISSEINWPSLRPRTAALLTSWERSSVKNTFLNYHPLANRTNCDRTTIGACGSKEAATRAEAPVPVTPPSSTGNKSGKHNGANDRVEDSSSGKPFNDLIKLGKVLGEGAFSVMKEGSHRQSNQPMAIKIVTKSKLSKQDENALKDEIAVLTELKHKHIIRLYDVFDEAQYYYLVMEKIMGGELFDRIVQKCYYKENEARDVCKILFDAMRFCHQHRIAHRDLKPENLLVTSESDDSDIKIADFGFAKKVKAPNSLTTQCGTSGYVAPEILEGKPYDTQADMWSLGVLVYILVGGYPPFIEQNYRELFRKIRKGLYVFHEECWGHVSDDAKGLIRKLLTVSPMQRYDAEAAMRNGWIGADASKLEARNLGVNLEQFKKFNAKRKFKATAKTVVAVNKLQSLGINFKLTL